MSNPTVAEKLALTLPTDLADCLRKVLIGEILAGIIPRTVFLTGLTSSAAQVMVDEDGVECPGLIASVTDGSDAPLSIIHDGAVGAGEVLIEYDSNGLATLTFNAAVTAFSVTMMRIPADHGDTLAGEL